MDRANTGFSSEVREDSKEERNRKGEGAVFNGRGERQAGREE